MTKKIKIVETADTEEIKQQGRMTNAERNHEKPPIWRAFFVILFVISVFVFF